MFVEATRDGAVQKTWYYSPAEIRKIFGEHFKIIAVKPVGLFLPPSYLEYFFRRKKILLRLLNQLEKWFSFSFLSNRSDHFVMVLEASGL